jgi:hypothetical protein
VSATTRRAALGRGLVALAGIAGLGGAKAAGGSRSPEEPLVLYARSLEGEPSAARSGPLVQRGDRLTLRADLLDRPNGEPVGELHGTSFALHGAGANAAAPERLELHTFRLADGTIIGSGMSGPLDGEFAILGGTGRYAGARGTYVARLSRLELGGDGTAVFRLSLTA